MQRRERNCDGHSAFITPTCNMHTRTHVKKGAINWARSAWLSSGDIVAPWRECKADRLLQREGHAVCYIHACTREIYLSYSRTVQVTPRCCSGRHGGRAGAIDSRASCCHRCCSSEAGKGSSGTNAADVGAKQFCVCMPNMRFQIHNAKKKTSLQKVRKAGLRNLRAL